MTLSTLAAADGQSAACVKASTFPKHRAVTARDLATIADIGRSDPYDSDSLFGLSPTGDHIAFVVRRGDPTTNDFCQQLIIQDIAGEKPPTIIDIGGTLIRTSISIWGIAALPTGSAAIIRPRWSPDGKTIAFLKRVDGSTQIWTVGAEGSASHQATSLGVDVDDFVWLPDGRGFVVASRPALQSVRTRIEREALVGYLFDNRFSPMESNRPFVLDPIPTRYDRVELSVGRSREASPAEQALLHPSVDKKRPPSARLFARSEEGATAWTEPASAGRLLAPDQIVVADRSHGTKTCTDADCAHVRRLWWHKNVLLWISREGPAQSRTALYRWNPAEHRPRRLLATTDNLIGCLDAGPTLICAREGSSTPRRVEVVDMRSGVSRLLFDPNSELAARTFGEIRRYFYHNDFGIECYFDLVLPVGHKPGEKHPMVVVQYTSQGFLRGGTGDEVPVQALAARGFVVLSFEHPDFTPQARAANNELELRRINRRDWLERRSVESALERAVAIAVDTGAVDRSRIGISGFSEGSAIVQWALINSSLFAVASLGTCCEDKVAQPLNGGPGYEAHLREHGYPPFDSASDHFWAPYSLAQNVDKIRTPILLQVVNRRANGTPYRRAKGTPFHDGARLIGHAPLRCARRREGGARPEARAAQSIF